MQRAVRFFFGNTGLSLELWNVIAGISGFDDKDYPTDATTASTTTNNTPNIIKIDHGISMSGV